MEFTPLHLSSYRKLLLAKIIPLSKIWWKYTETRTKLSYMHHRDPPPRIFIAIFPVIVWLDQRSQWKNYIGLGDGANVVANPVHHRVEAPLSNWSRLDLRVATIDRSELGEGSPSLRPRRDRREGGGRRKRKREKYTRVARGKHVVSYWPLAAATLPPRLGDFRREEVVMPVVEVAQVTGT